MHNNEDRGMLKWQPFYSVMSEDEVKSSVNKKNINIKPDYSEDQINEIEAKIIEAYNSKSTVNVEVYDTYHNKIITGVINKLDPLNKTIYVNKSPILFENILNIYFE